MKEVEGVTVGREGEWVGGVQSHLNAVCRAVGCLSRKKRSKRVERRTGLLFSRIRIYFRVLCFVVVRDEGDRKVDRGK